jgi:multidrug efflux system membrane fusion protein
MSPRNRKSWWSGVALVLPLVTLLGGCRGEEAKVEQAIVRPVRVAVVGEAVRGHRITYSGVVRPRIESAIGFRVAGKIVERFVNVGDSVDVDQVIARLDDADLQLAANSAKAAVASARSRCKVASDNLERGKALLPKAIISQAAYDTRRNEMDAAGRSTRQRRNYARLPMRSDTQR